MIYNWSTYPLTCLLEHIWNKGAGALQQAKYPEPTLVELSACVECALNFMHTGNTAVIATSLMNPLWIGLAIVHDGLPCLNPTILPALTSTVPVNLAEWPYDQKGQPKSASKGSQVRNYGERQFKVSIGASMSYKVEISRRSSIFDLRPFSQ